MPSNKPRPISNAKLMKKKAPAVRRLRLSPRTIGVALPEIERGKIILGLVGEMAAGKTTVTNYLKEKYGAETWRFSDMLRDILKRLHLESTRANTQALSTLLRQKFGDDLMSKVIALDVSQAPAPLIITEGIRRPSDITYLKDLPGWHLVAIQADERTRYERLIKREENPDDRRKTWEQFQTDSRQEPEQKIKALAQQAEFTIDNNGTRQELATQIEKIIKKMHVPH